MLSEFISRYNIEKYREKQFFDFYFKQGKQNLNELNWPKDLISKLESEISLNILTKIAEFKDKNTTRVIFQVGENSKDRFESVLLKHKGSRFTVCVSSMIGCPLNCKFCATGKLGFRRNLSYLEIVEQVMFFERRLKKSGNRVSNVVFMGMGEPLLNFDNVLKAYHYFTDEDKLGLSDRKVSISTAGIVKGLKKLIDSDFKGKLAISLHSANQKLREKLMPIAKSNKLNSIFNVLDEYILSRNKRIFFEYILIDGINDSNKDALDLVMLLKNRHAHVNLIPYNKIDGVNFKPSQEKRIIEFQKILDKHNLSNSVRFSMGGNLNASCGQLNAKLLKR